MGKFDDELKKIKIPAIRKIALYLKSRDDIRENLDKENKSLEEMFSYILNHARQKATGGCACLSDEEVYGLAVHYYDEDDIKVEKKNFRTNADGSADPSKLVKPSKTAEKKEEPKVVIKEKVVVDQEAIDKAVAKALEEREREEKQKKEEAKKKKEELKAQKKAEKASKTVDNGQLDIFALIGDEDE